MTDTMCPLCGSSAGARLAATPDFGRLVRCSSCGLLYKDPLPAELPQSGHIVSVMVPAGVSSPARRGLHR